MRLGELVASCVRPEAFPEFRQSVYPGSVLALPPAPANESDWIRKDGLHDTVRYFFRTFELSRSRGRTEGLGGARGGAMAVAVLLRCTAQNAKSLDKSTVESAGVRGTPAGREICSDAQPDAFVSSDWAVGMLLSFWSGWAHLRSCLDQIAGSALWTHGIC